MKLQKKNQRLWLFLFVGILIGLFVATGFQLTHSTHAQQMASNIQPEMTAPVASPMDVTVADQLSNTFASVAAKVNPSVVTIFTETDVKVQQGPFGQFFGDDFFKRFFEMPEHQGTMKRMGLGSGVIVDANGVILTNNHVVDDADNIKVRLLDGREFEGKVKGTDPQTDLAVINIDARNLTPITLGNSDQLRVGDWVLAIGSPLNPQLEHTVTAGIVSAKGRSGVGLTQYEDYIQTDAAINPGNSGGALTNLRGELIGINSAIATQTGGNQGIGFAIPVNLAQKVMTDIIEKGSVVRGWLGVLIQNISPEIAKAMNLKTTKGVIVSKVQNDSPAEKAGLKEGDVIVGFNGRGLDNSVELSTWVAGTSPGSRVDLNILRNGKAMTVTATLEKLNPKAQELAQGVTTYSQIGIKVANVVPGLAQKYQLQGVNQGVVVVAVDPNSVAAQVGIQEGDLILQVDHHQVRNVGDLQNLMEKVQVGDNVLFFLRRGEANLFVAFAMPEK